MDFGIAAQGDLASTVLPWTSENGSNASFLVSGQPNISYAIALPPGSISMSRFADRVDVGQFRSFPSDVGVTDGNGKQMIYVGATRNAISLTQQRGNYSGNFTITIVY